MKIENQVCTFEQAERLNQLGVKESSLWFWQSMKEPVIEGCSKRRIELYANVGHPISKSIVDKQYAAYTVAELGMMLPPKIASLRDENGWVCQAHKDQYPFPQIKEGFNFFIVRSDASEAEARAAMLIYLLENNLIPTTP